jgi:hypothetical protein
VSTGVGAQWLVEVASEDRSVTELVATDVYPELLRYVGMAARLQDANISSPTGRDVTIPLVDDALCQWVTIYDVIERRYAGFSNALQQLRWGSENPKRWQALAEFDGFFDSTPFTAWLYLCLLHRVTGSGASFSSDHGFRNTVVPDAARAYRSGKSMPNYVWGQMQTGRPVFTSIGNQIPAFPKPHEPYDRGSELYIHRVMPSLIMDLNDWLVKESRGVAPYFLIKDVVDWMGAWHRSHGINRFEFVHTAFVMDIAEYHPHLVSPMSHCYFGANADKCAALLFEKPKGLKKPAFHDAVMERFQSDVWALRPETPGFPMSLEDVLCDGVRWMRNYIPKGYDHLTPDQIQTSAPDLLGRHESYYRHLELWGEKRVHPTA